MHRLFEGQSRTLFFCHPRIHFSECFCSQECTLAQFSTVGPRGRAPTRTHLTDVEVHTPTARNLIQCCLQSCFWGFFGNKLAAMHLECVLSCVEKEWGVKLQGEDFYYWLTAWGWPAIGLKCGLCCVHSLTKHIATKPSQWRLPGSESSPLSASLCINHSPYPSIFISVAVIIFLSVSPLPLCHLFLPLSLSLLLARLQQSSFREEA